jgi:hypothetical protein
MNTHSYKVHNLLKLKIFIIFSIVMEPSSLVTKYIIGKEVRAPSQIQAMVCILWIWIAYGSSMHHFGSNLH